MNNSAIKNTLILLILLVTSGCTVTSKGFAKKTIYLQQEPNIKPDKIPQIITIWVHGTTNNPLFHYFHSSPLGLVSWSDLPAKYHLKKIGEILEEYDSANFNRDAFYTFGWSGNLSFKDRENAGKKLEEAVRLAQSLHEKRFSIVPRVRIITHSHGGNVALNAGRDGSTIIVDELILLACPVQDSTAKYISSEAFRRVYSFYSCIDLLQVIDPQGLYSNKKTNTKLFSERRFPAHPKLRQAEISYDIRSLNHIEFISKDFAKALPGILREIKKADLDPKQDKDRFDFAIKIVD